MPPGERTLLEVVRQLEPDAYGVPIRCEVQRRRGWWRASRRSIHAGLAELECRGLVNSQVGEDRNWRWHLTDDGVRALEAKG
jgi:DNA-binding PadR family transcriptional regulator